MRLRTLESFWLLKNGLLYTYPSLRESVTTDIVVIGGGITGALISHALMEEGYKTILVDKKDIGQGSTSATTAMLQYEIDVPLYELSEMIGRDAAANCYKAGVKAIDDLKKLIDNNKIDCGFQSKNSLYIAHNLKARARLLKEFTVREQIGLRVAWLEKDEIMNDYGIKSFGGIRSEDAASVDAYKLAHELIHLNCKRGMEVYDQTVLENIDYNADDIVITTEAGHTIKANKVVFCTGYEATKMLKEKLADIFYTWACISEEKIALKEKLYKTLVWDTGDPYFYMRTTSEGRLLMGGEDSSYRDSILRQKIKQWKSKKLVRKVEAIMPDISFEEDFNWGGAFGTTKDGLPYIGISPEYNNAIFVLGFGGNGISFSVQGMDIIKDILKGRNNQLAEYYRFER